MRLHVHALLQKLPRAAAVQLDAVERQIGVLQQQVGAVAIARRHGYADAGAHHDLVSIDLERPAEHIHDLLGQGRTFIEVTQRILQHDELLAAESRDHIGPAYDTANRSATAQSKASPQVWPKVSLTCVKSSSSTNRMANGPRRFRAASAASV